MSRRLVLELTNVEARALLLAASESRMTVEKSLTIPLVSEDEKAAETTLEQTVVDALSDNGITRLETIAVVGRTDVELRLLNLPPVPDEELPNLVRFQTAQELPNLDASTPLDFLPLGDSPEQPRRVLAAVLKPGVKQRLEKICHDAKLTLAHIVLRSAASTSLMLHQKPELQAGCCLLVEILGRQVELAAVNQGRVVFLRHVLLPADPADSEEAADSLVSEIRRTRVVAANQENAETIEPIVLVDSSPPRRALAKRLGTAVDVPVLLIDPLPPSVVANREVTPSSSDRDHYTAMLGAAADDAAGRPHAFDFLHPRQPPKPPSRRNTYILAGLTAAVVVLAIVVLNSIQTARLKDDVLKKQQESATLDEQVRRGDVVIAASEKVEDWLDGEVVWLDELRWLSERFPPAREAKLTKLHVSAGNRREMVLSGLARNVDAVTQLDDSLQDETHQVVGKTKNENRSDSKYEIEFGSSVQITSPQ
ncbi:MAG: hypothetical protein JW888_09780 [Pirellulales bacterium]|nr:hypothetical protein [Pirellulales bacterium]